MDGVIVIQVFIIAAIATWAVRRRFKSERARQVDHRRALTRGVAAVGIPLGSVLCGVWIGSSPIVEPLALVIESIAGAFVVLHMWLLSRRRARHGALLLRLGMTHTQLLGLGAVAVAGAGLIWLTAEPSGRMRYTVTFIGVLGLAELVLHHAVGVQFRKNGVLTWSSFREWDRVRDWKLERPTSESSEAKPKLAVRFDEALPLGQALFDPAHYPERGTGVIVADQDLRAALAVLEEYVAAVAWDPGRPS